MISKKVCFPEYDPAKSLFSKKKIIQFVSFNYLCQMYR